MEKNLKFELGRWGESPCDSIFRNFDVSNEIEFQGENETGRRILRLRYIHKPEDFSKIQKFSWQREDRSESIPLSSTTSKVLELEAIEGDQRNLYYMIIDPKGIRTEPIPPPPPFPAMFLGARIRISLQEDSERFGKLEIIGRQDVLLRTLKIVEPRLNKLSVIVSGGVPILNGDIGIGRLFPLPFMGEGMARVASLVLAIGNASNGVVMIDEIENGLHHTIIPKIWLAIGEAAREFNTQIFATTHSRECIEAAHNAFKENGIYDFKLHRLERIEGCIRAISYDQETLEAAIETGLEVR